VASSSAFFAEQISVILADFSIAMLNVASILAIAEPAVLVLPVPLVAGGVPPPPQEGGTHDIRVPCIAKMRVDGGWEHPKMLFIQYRSRM